MAGGLSSPGQGGPVERRQSTEQTNASWSKIVGIATILGTLIAGITLWVTVADDEGEGKGNSATPSSPSAMPSENAAPAGPAGGIESTSPAPPADPYIITNPNSGPPGASFTVTGKGFKPNSRVRITLGPCIASNALRDLDADESGKFSVRVEVPGDASSGTYTIMAFDPANLNCTVEPETPFTVE